MDLSQGNGALPFPGRRVEVRTEEEYGVAYEIREYLGCEVIASWRQIFPRGVNVPESTYWTVMEQGFNHYMGWPQ